MLFRVDSFQHARLGYRSSQRYFQKCMCKGSSGICRHYHPRRITVQYRMTPWRGFLLFTQGIEGYRKCRGGSDNRLKAAGHCRTNMPTHPRHHRQWKHHAAPIARLMSNSAAALRRAECVAESSGERRECPIVSIHVARIRKPAYGARDVKHFEVPNTMQTFAKVSKEHWPRSPILN